MWIKLLQNNANIGEMIKPQYVNGTWRKPMISGRNKKDLKRYFESAGVPWLYGSRPETHVTSCYNRKPKGTSRINSYETRIAMIRKNLALQDEKSLKLRQDRLNNKPLSGNEQVLVGVYKALQSEVTAAKYK